MSENTGSSSQDCASAAIPGQLLSRPENWKSCYLRPAARILQSRLVPAVNQLTETVSGKSLAPQPGLEPMYFQLTGDARADAEMMKQKSLSRLA